MASTILSFLKFFGPRTARTSEAPNSWAVISLWRRFFQIKEAEEEERLEVIVRALEEEIAKREYCPVACEELVAARNELIRQHHRQLISQPTANDGARAPSTLADLIAATNASRSQQQVNNPDLQVPAGPQSADYVYLPQ